MANQRTIDEFLSQSTLALAGLSRSGKKFGNTVLRDLTAKGFTNSTGGCRDSWESYHATKREEGIMMTEATLKGSCLCGGVAYEMSPPFIFFHHCHCSRCRKSSGAPYGANILVRASQFRWTRGEDLVKRWQLPEAQYYCTGWCSVCGSKLPWQSRNEKGYLVPVGTLDDDPGSLPEKNIYWASRAPWLVDPSELPTFDEGS